MHKRQDHEKVCIDGLQLNLSGSMVIGGNPAITHLPTDFLTFREAGKTAALSNEEGNDQQEVWSCGTCGV